MADTAQVTQQFQVDASIAPGSTAAVTQCYHVDASVAPLPSVQVDQQYWVVAIKSRQPRGMFPQVIG
jgi:hypothetical protein